jgi:hypothetical protein
VKCNLLSAWTVGRPQLSSALGVLHAGADVTAVQHLTAAVIFLSVASHSAFAQVGTVRSDSEVASYCAARDAQSNACTLYEVSMVQLIANPELFEGRRVLVIGFVHLEFEGNAIYMHREDFEAGLLKNGLWVEFRPGVLRSGERYSDRYLVVSGVFTSRKRGHLGLFSGMIGDIDRADPWPSGADLGRRSKPPS